MNQVEKIKDAKPLPQAWEKLLIQGDIKSLNTEQRTSYYLKVCESMGLNPLTRPFDYMTFQGREILYARKDCTDQLRKIHNVSITITSRETLETIYCVTARATLPDGRTDESIGALLISGLKGAELANALMKCETKAKRRVTLSICGLGILDETEIQDAKVETVKYTPPAWLPGIEPKSTAETFVERFLPVQGGRKVITDQIIRYRAQGQEEIAKRIETELAKVTKIETTQLPPDELLPFETEKTNEEES